MSNALNFFFDMVIHAASVTALMTGAFVTSAALWFLVSVVTVALMVIFP